MIGLTGRQKLQSPDIGSMMPTYSSLKHHTHSRKSKSRSPRSQSHVLAAAILTLAFLPHNPTIAAEPKPTPTVIEGESLEYLILERRGQQQPIPGNIVSISAEGVRIQERGMTSLISWDLIRRITQATPAANQSNSSQQPATPDPQTTSDIADLSREGEHVWRAAARLERGDWRAAEPLFEQLFAARFQSPPPTQQQNQQQPAETTQGPTSQIIAEGLLRSRLHRGARLQAVEPWLHYAKLAESRASSTEPWIGGRTSLDPVLDSLTRLPPHPPIWSPDRVMERVSQEQFWQHVESGTGVAAAVARLYRASMEVERGMPIDPVLSAVSRHRGDAGIELTRDILLSRGGRDADERESARRRLNERARSDTSPRWVEAWCRAAIGRSLIREPAEQDRRRGMIELMHLPARFSATQPTLTALALAEVAWTLEDLADPQAATVVRSVITDNRARHPLRSWPIELFSPPTQPARTLPATIIKPLIRKVTAPAWPQPQHPHTSN